MYSLTAKILDVDTPTINGHIYPHDVIERAIKKIDDGELLGVLANDVTTDAQDFFNVSELNVSHKISNLRLENDELLGDVIVLDTPKGKLLQEMMNAKVDISFWTFGIGTLSAPDEKGIHTISNFSISSINASPKDEN